MVTLVQCCESPESKYAKLELKSVTGDEIIHSKKKKRLENMLSINTLKLLFTDFVICFLWTVAHRITEEIWNYWYRIF